jgi:hypothetical protein
MRRRFQGRKRLPGVDVARFFDPGGELGHLDRIRGVDIDRAPRPIEPDLGALKVPFATTTTTVDEIIRGMRLRTEGGDPVVAMRRRR